MFAVRAGDAIDRAKSSDAVRHDHCAEAVDSRIRIGRVGGVELVAISNPGRFTSVFELLHESQVVIAGNAKPGGMLKRDREQKRGGFAVRNASIASGVSFASLIQGFNLQLRTCTWHKLGTMK